MKHDSPIVSHTHFLIKEVIDLLVPLDTLKTVRRNAHYSDVV